MAKENKGLLFFYDWRDPIEELSGDEVKSLLLAMLDFSKDGTEPPQFKGGAKIAAAFMFPAIDRFRKQSEAGRKGGTTTQEARRAAMEIKTEVPSKDVSKGASKGATEGSTNDGSRVAKQQHNTTQIQDNTISPLNPPAGEAVGVDGEEKFFSVFWEEYPKKTEYEKVRQAFREMHFTDESFGKLMFLLDGWKSSDQWTKSGGQFITSPYNFLTKIFPHNQQPLAAPPPRPATPTGFESSSFESDAFTEAALRKSYGEDYDTLFNGG